MSVFSYLDYKLILKASLEFKKKIDSRYSYKSMAEFVRVQPPYLTKVINGEAHMNQDQLYLASKYLEFNASESKYINLLLEYEKSVVFERKSELKNEIEKMQKKHLSTQVAREIKTLSSEKENMYVYYMDPINLLVHMALMIDKYQNNIKQLAIDLGLKQEKVVQVISKLKELEIIEEGEEGYNILIDTVHLPSSSALCTPHQSLMRQVITSFYSRGEIDEGYNLILTFTADKHSQKRIQDLFLSFLKDANKIIKSAPSKNVYQMNFDLFSWT